MSFLLLPCPERRTYGRRSLVIERFVHSLFPQKFFNRIGKERAKMGVNAMKSVAAGAHLLGF